MKKLMGKAKSAFSDTRSHSSDSCSDSQSDKLLTIQKQETQSKINPPTALDILRYRYHHGANLGSCFVLEKWLWPGLFESGARGDSELDAVEAYVHHSQTGIP